MSNAVRTTVNLGKSEWDFVIEDAKRVLDSDDYKGPDDFNFSKYCRRVLAERKAVVMKPKKGRAA